MLRDWTKGKRKGLPFGVPMVWREPKDHTSDCYFCIVNTKGVGKKNRHMITYPSIPSAIRPIPHCEELPVPVFQGFASSEDADSEHEQEDYEGCYQEHQESSEDSSFDSQQISAPQQFKQPELNDLGVIWDYPRKQLSC
jgi:hypothetical protein